MFMISECKDTKTPENTHYPNYRKNEYFSGKLILEYFSEISSWNIFRKSYLGNQPTAFSLSFRITAMLSIAHSIR